MPEETQDQEAQVEQAEQQEKDQGDESKPKYAFEAEDVGTLKKKVTITVTRQRINEKLDEMFGELGQSALVPGFRIGRAPRRLVEKRFGKEVSHDVRNALVGESLGEVMDGADFKTLGEPDLDLDAIELPDTGDLSYSFEVEVAPEFELPELAGIAVEKHASEITDENIDQYMTELCESRATFAAADEPAAEGDMITADTRVSGEAIDPAEAKDQSLRVAAGQIEGLPLVDLGKELAGKKAGDVATMTVEVPAAHPNESWRGKEAVVEVAIKEVRKRNVPALDDEFARSMGADSVAEMREFFVGRVRQRVESAARQNVRDQICKYLLDNTVFDLPEAVAARHAAGALQRRYVDLLKQGVPREQIEENITELKAAAEKQSADVLKLQFIISRIAEAHEITADQDEVNSRIAQMASMYGRRPERVRHELEQDGTISQIHAQLIEEKVIDKLLGDAKITEVSADEKKAEAEAETKPKTKKKAKAKAKTKPKAKKKAAGKSDKKSTDQSGA